jgi:hypothetical protein
MASCCRTTCSCVINAGSRVTITGNGSATSPYVINADQTMVTVTDTPSVDMTISGSGTAASPYNISSAVKLDSTPPGGGTNLIQSNAEGLYLECAQVRTCFSAGNGAAYNAATGVITARLSANPGNTTTFGSDGGIYTPTTGQVTVADTPTVDMTLTGAGTAASPYVVSSAVKLEPTPPGGGSNLIKSDANGLYLECAQVRTCFSTGPGATYDPATGVIGARLSTAAGNGMSFGPDGGLYSTASAGGTVVTAGDTNTVDNTVTGAGTAASPYVVTSAVKLEPTPPGGGSNLIKSDANGLYLECAQVRTCFSAGPGATYDPATGVIGAKISTDAGNATVLGSDGGIYSPPGGGTPTVLQVGDTNTVDNTLTGAGTAASPYVVTSAVKLEPTPPGGGSNLIKSDANGLYLECAQVRTCFSAGPGATYDPATGVIGAKISTDAGNTTVFGTDGGILTPAAAALVTGCGLSGAGTAASPLVALPVAASREWSTDWSCDAAANSTLHCDPTTGTLWTPPEHTSAAVTIQQNHPLGTPTIGAGGGYIIVDSTAFSEGTYTADSLTACRGITFDADFTGHVEATWPAGTTFDLGYAVSINGGAPAVRVLQSKLQAGGVAGHERFSFSISQASVLAPHTGYSVRVYPAIRVLTGSVTLNQWITDTNLIVVTR